MTWIKLDDKTPRHPKVAGLSDRAFRAWIGSLCYASEFLTDGLIPSAFLIAIRPRVCAELIGAGLWLTDGHTYTIHDYLIHQTSKDYVLQEREMNRRRGVMKKDPQLRAAIQARDGDNCRYCGCRISWSDRRGSFGATYDHVIPRGPETIDNLVACCRGCNSKKANRTPDQAGMALIQPRTDLGRTQEQSKPEAEADTEAPEKQIKKEQRSSSLIVSPEYYERRKQFCAFVGSKIEVPSGLHAELRKNHGGSNPELELQGWYLELNAQAENEEWRIPQTKVFYSWFKGLYAQKFPAPSVNGAKSFNDEIDEWARS